MDSKMNAWTWGLLVLLGLIWGGSFFFARIAVQHVPPLTLVFLRLLLAALALHVYIAGRLDIYSIFKARWREFLILGVINNVLPHALIFFGQTRIGAGLAAILNATTPIWTVLIANYLTSDEKLSSAKIAGCLVGLLGTIVLVGPGISAGSEAALWALLFPVLAAVSYGFAATYGKRFKGVPAAVTAAGQLTASSLIALPLSLLADRPWALTIPPLEVLLAILALALLSTAFAYILYFRVIATAGATNASLVTLLVPPSAILLGVLFLRERLSLSEFAGMALIGFGLVILDGRAYRLLAKPA
ncbi:MULTISPECIES: DMT family transporter [Rhizobium]|uniref:DMT family transporter n=1 Tax=Rhizobium TaxID=379 RepID=UPI001B32AA3D|nr:MULTISPECIES: DMT family transporter [Rhizobium]MBX4905870.1 DMT family transporter [Rhizobium bangladeshense]MBX5212724.1 DMT family transporter [Rhizobium sp. NLR9a]MBX5231565.1 DMT family transporter [Rhizobium sp. NLR4a]MBX5242993.1 DMT family transporter [Rhizobium sp. NLR3b]MBX5249203.1 DMT family transporter [Rhizobium sp. NLR4b]